MDCTFCLDCARACPYDNVALSPRAPLEELTHDRGPARWDMAFLVVALTLFGISNAFGMVSPVYALHTWLAHYGFHFSIAGLAIVPVMQSFMLDHGILWLGLHPDWGTSRVLPQEWIFPLQIGA